MSLEVAGKTQDGSEPGLGMRRGCSLAVAWQKPRPNWCLDGGFGAARARSGSFPRKSETLTCPRLSKLYFLRTHL